MIPYWAEPRLQLWGLTLYAFGMLLTCALVVGSIVFVYHARQSGLGLKMAAAIVAIGLPIGLLGSHLWYCATEDRTALLEFGGVASFGGIFSFLVVLCVYVFVEEREFGERFQRWLDVAVGAFSVTAVISRVGCFMAHDHLGSLTNSWLGVKFPNGTRYDLGLLDCMFWGVVCIIIVASYRRRMSMRNGVLSSGVALAYGLFRLWADANKEHPTSGVSSRLAALLLIALGLGNGFRSKFNKFRWNRNDASKAVM
jgi:phosphatidylglycerol---prolipoprotein diacylglyceryl transferase